MKLDRALQLEILTKLATAYPSAGSLKEIEAEGVVVNANLFYLMEHGLVNAKVLTTMNESVIANTKITASGMDFLADDGGLTAILGVVTVKLHDETIRDLIAARIESSELPAEEKTGLLHQLKELRGESITHLTMKLLDLGCEKLPEALPLIQKALAGYL